MQEVLPFRIDSKEDKNNLNKYLSFGFRNNAIEM